MPQELIEIPKAYIRFKNGSKIEIIPNTDCLESTRSDRWKDILYELEDGSIVSYRSIEQEGMFK